MRLLYTFVLGYVEIVTENGHGFARGYVGMYL